ncbi:MAG TPA: FadR/GntR family transcriptional regulator [Anaerolineae bacterium]|nr:FadR/GntR family transcriptional regulator [Anaerolineae bacterium]
MDDPTRFSPVSERTRLYQAVVSQVTERILADHLQPGDRLPSERDLSLQLGVSRTAVREAIRALEEKGLVEVRQGSGTFVRSPAPDSVSASLALYLHTNVARYLQLMDLRSILEPEIASRLAQSVEPEDLARLQGRILRMHQLLDSPKEYAAEDAAFHMDFYRAANNEVLLMIMQPVMDLLEEAMSVSFREPGSSESSLTLHEKMVEQIAAGDAAGARATVKQLLARGEMRMRHRN